MNGEDFYESFKDALKYVGLSFGEMSSGYIYVENDTVCVTYYDRTACITLPTKAVFERDVLGKKSED